MFKKVCSVGFLLWTMLGSSMIYGQEPGQIVIPRWAKSDLLTAEVSGLVPTDYVKYLNQPINEEQLTQIIEGLKGQCRQAGLNEQEVKSIIQIGTREQVLSSYYNVLQGFDGRVDFKKDMISYMQYAGVIKGDEKGNLNLEKPCTVQDAILFANRIVTDIYKQTEAGAKGFVWEVSDENNTVYLLGTIHLGRQELYPFSAGLNNILEKADKVAFEVDFNNQREQVYFYQKQMYLDDTNLKEHLDEETYIRTVEAFKQYGMSEEEINRYKPWALSNTLAMLNVNTGDKEDHATTSLPVIDLYVYTKAFLENKEILEIEGYNFQADLFDGLDEAYQIESLKTNLDAFESEDEVDTESVTLVNEWVRQFLEGNIEAFATSYGKDQALENDDPLMKLLFENRDERMTNKIVEYLGDKENATYLVTVGVGHMVGKEGIINRLQNLGYTVNVVGGN